jgi:pyruvate/2-oxoglutarate dehydrogenase complex dihydrolipoamide acyltransferase (E2) component
MNEKIQPYHVVDFTPERRVMAGFLDLASARHRMYALLEVDVTIARQFIEAYKAQTGEGLSFTGHLAFCLARAVDENKAVQAYRKGRNQLVMFDDVDVGIMIEQRIGEKRVLTGHVIRKANRKTYQEIHEEIRAVQSKRAPVSAEKASWFRSAMLLPWPLSRMFNALARMVMRRDPTMLTSMAGTVGISSVGMFGKGHSGWGISSGTHVLDLTVGSMAWKPAVVDGRIEPRQILNLTVVFDHEVIDGAPAARFTRRLVELIESGCGLSRKIDMDADGPAPIQAIGSCQVNSHQIISWLHRIATSLPFILAALVNPGVAVRLPTAKNAKASRPLRTLIESMTAI